jgi:hypothetical protein
MAGGKGGRPKQQGLMFSPVEVERITKRRVRFVVAATDAGVTPKLLGERLFEALNATFVERLKTKNGKDANGKPAEYEDVERIDVKARMHALEIAARLLSIEPPKQISKDVNVQQVHGVVMLPPKDAIAPPPERKQLEPKPTYDFEEEKDDDPDGKL